MEAGLGVCIAGRVLPKLRRDAKLKHPVEVSDSCSCGPEGRRRMYWAHVPVVEGCWVPAVHANCVHNEEASLLLRTLGETPENPVHSMLRDEFKVLRNLIRRKQVERFTLERVAKSYSGRLGKRYREALKTLKEDAGIHKEDKRISAFLKAEKFNPLLKPSKPRMIMARSPRFNLVLASYLKPVEHALWRSIKGSVGRRTRQVGKGLNAKQRARVLKEKMEDLGDATVFEVDGKSFESHVTKDDLKLEHSIYLAAYPGKGTPGKGPRGGESDDRPKSGRNELKRLLSCQLRLKGRTVGGLKFERDGARASGDFNTGLGNTVIMLCSVRAGMRLLIERAGSPIRWDTLVDGDNALIFVEAKWSEYVQTNFAEAVSKVSNQELAVENPVRELEAVVFGQCKPCWNGNEYIMVRDPFKTLSNSFSSYRHFNNWNFGVRLIKAISQCELALARGIPILESYFARALELVSNVPDLKNPEEFLEVNHLGILSLLRSRGETLADVMPIGVTADARRSFATAWGVSVERQLSLERELVAGLNFPLIDGSRWAEMKRRLFGVSVRWDTFEVTDGWDGDVPEEHIPLYFDAR